MNAQFLFSATISCEQEIAALSVFEIWVAGHELKVIKQHISCFDEDKHNWGQL